MSDVLANDRLDALEAKHRALHDAVSALARQAYLTPEEKRRFADLKKRKLIAKDALFALRRDSCS